MNRQIQILEVNKSYAFFKFFKMSKENCFSHLKKRFDEKSEEWQKTWDFLPDTVSLADKVLEELKLVGAMKEVRTDSNVL
jgi:hypothetical protein